MATVVPVTLVTGLDSSRYVASKSHNFTVSPADTKSSMRPSVSTSQVKVNTPANGPSSVSSTSVAKAATPGKPTQISTTTKPATNTRPVTLKPATANPVASTQPTTPPSSIKATPVSTGAAKIAGPSLPIDTAGGAKAPTTTSSNSKSSTDSSAVSNASKEPSSVVGQNSLPATTLAKPVTEPSLPGITTTSVAQNTTTATAAAVGLAEALVKITDSGIKIHSKITGTPLLAPDTAALSVAPSGNKADVALSTTSVPMPTNITHKPTISANQVPMYPGIPLLQAVAPTCMAPNPQFTAVNAAQCYTSAGYNVHNDKEVKYNHQHDQGQHSEHTNNSSHDEIGLQCEEQNDNHEHPDQCHVAAERQDGATHIPEETQGHNDHGAGYPPVQGAEHNADLDREHENDNRQDPEGVDEGVDEGGEQTDRPDGGEYEYAEGHEQHEGDMEGQDMLITQEGEYSQEHHDFMEPEENTLHETEEDVHDASEGQQEVGYEGAENFTEGDVEHQDGVLYEVVEEAQEGDIPYDGNELEEQEPEYGTVEQTQVEIDEHDIHDVEEGNQILEGEEFNAGDEDHDVENEYDNLEGEDFAYE